MKILIADDDSSLSRIIQLQLQNLKHQVDLVVNGVECLSALKNTTYDICILDLNMPKKNGIQVLTDLENNLPCPIIVLTAYQDVTTTVTAIKLGAFDYLTKPFDSIKLQRTIELAKKQWDLDKENENLKLLLFEKENSDFVKIQDESLLKVINLSSHSDESILISGETGTGKDYLAKYIHSNSSRSNKPFLAINCASIPEALLESELFGHIKGSFTGAIQDKLGLLAAVGEGTLLLDEIGDMSLEIQAKVLRVLENKTYRRLGELKESKFVGRVLSASHKDLNTLVQKGLFREDLLYRINIIPVSLPPLRERLNEIEIYVKKFLPGKRLTDSALSYLKERHWSGNIRELKNYCARLRVFLQSRKISKVQLVELEDLLNKKNTDNQYFTLPEEGVNVDNLIDDLLHQALKRCSQNQTRAGELLGLSRQQVIHRLRKWKS
ncbi:MAG: sigma-54-dependent Fis family transcriptional regulator [Flavobacteriaceae bacterium]|nr:sigma-54-dependent Fis family transcriptional regulator [Flavobacteriaceae bacterium]